MGIDSLLNQEEEDEVIEAITFGAQDSSIAGIDRDEDESVENEEEDESYSAKEHLKTLDIAMQILERNERQTCGTQSATRPCQKKLPLERQSYRRQSTLSEHRKSN